MIKKKIKHSYYNPDLKKPEHLEKISFSTTSNPDLIYFGHYLIHTDKWYCNRRNEGPFTSDQISKWRYI